MHRPTRNGPNAAAPLLLCSLLPARANASTTHGAARCAGAAAASTRSCVSAVGVELRSCYLTTGAGCTADDSQIAAALGAVETAVTADCRDSAAVSAAGFGALLT